MKLEDGLQRMSEIGLNIYGAVAIAGLPDDLRPYFPSEFRTWHLGLFGSGGRRLWDTLPDTNSEHPIDEFATAQLDWFAREVVGDPNYVLAYPHPTLVLPLQRLGRFLNLSRPSILGLDLHPKFGPWFAYRGIFLTSARIPEVRGSDFRAACESCAERPCQSACPIGAVKNSHSQFEINRCVEFRLSPGSICGDRCLSRLACPEGKEHKYSMAQIQYHMSGHEHRRKLLEFKRK